MTNLQYLQNLKTLPRKIRIQSLLLVSESTQKQFAIIIDKSEGLISDVISGKTVSAPVQNAVYNSILF